jgi:hypothetical protein
MRVDDVGFDASFDPKDIGTFSRDNIKLSAEEGGGHSHGVAGSDQSERGMMMRAPIFLWRLDHNINCSVAS